jgi:hypothetical protein
VGRSSRADRRVCPIPRLTGPFSEWISACGSPAGRLASPTAHSIHAQQAGLWARRHSGGAQAPAGPGTRTGMFDRQSQVKVKGRATSFELIHFRRDSQPSLSLHYLQPRCKALANHCCQCYPCCLECPCSLYFQPFQLRAWLTPLAPPCSFLLSAESAPTLSGAGLRAHLGLLGPARLRSAGAQRRRRGDSPRRAALASPRGPVGPGRVLFSFVSTPHLAASAWPGWARCEVR